MTENNGAGWLGSKECWWWTGVVEMVGWGARVVFRRRSDGFWAVEWKGGVEGSADSSLLACKDIDLVMFDVVQATHGGQCGRQADDESVDFVKVWHKKVQ